MVPKWSPARGRLSGAGTSGAEVIGRGSHAYMHAICCDSIASMANVLIRDVPAEDLDQIRSAAATQGMSLQAYLLEAVHAQASHLRRREALNRTATRLQHQRPVDDQDRQAVLEAIDDAHADRGARLGRAT